MVAVTGNPVGLTAMKAGILPVPLAPNPMEVLLLVHVYTVPATGPLSVTAAVADPAHTSWLAIAFTDGVGLTVMVKLTAPPPQPEAVGVTVMVAVIGALLVLVAVKDGILPRTSCRQSDGCIAVGPVVY